jgi:hypothetical protein
MKQTKPLNNFYVYIHLNPNSKEIFYVGKGRGNRKTSKSRNHLWKEYVENLGGVYEIIVIQDGISEKDALRLEADVISRIQNHYPDNLTNISQTENEILGNDVYFNFGVDLDGLFDRDDSEPKTGNNNLSVSQSINPRFQNSTTKEICETLSFFPNKNNEKYLKFSDAFYEIQEIFWDLESEVAEFNEDAVGEFESLLQEIEDECSSFISAESESFAEFISQMDEILSVYMDLESEEGIEDLFQQLLKSVFKLRE